MGKAIKFQFKNTNEPKHTVVNVPKPTPADDEILLKVQYSALDTSLDYFQNKTLDRHFVNSTKDPLYLGYHYSGIVQELGSKVTSSKGEHKAPKKGAKVFGFLQYEPSQAQGAFAEYITVKPYECAILGKKSNVTNEVSAASGTETLTALQAIRDFGKMGDNGKGKSILIVGAGGGVGSAGVQIAKKMGATVTAVVSSKDVDNAKKWGADHIINRSADPHYVKALIKDKKHTFDIVFDTPNSLSTGQSIKLLKKNGVVVNTLPNMSMLWGMIQTMFSSKSYSFVHVVSKRNDLELIRGWMEQGSLKIPIDSVFKIKDMQAAIDKQRGKKKGRVVIQVESGWN